MFPEIECFGKWLRCRSPHATTHVHYTSDVKLFFAWAGKPSNAITLHNVDAYIAHCRTGGHAAATVNRRLAALRAFFFRFLDLESGDAPATSIPPRQLSIHRSGPPRESSHVAVFRRVWHAKQNGSFAGIVSVV
jgi:site-specific recombinase XerC